MFLPTPRKANWMPLPETAPRLLLALAATAVASLGFGASADASPAALSVLSPSDDSLETGTVDVKVHVPAGASKVTAHVAGKDVALRGTGAIRTASIPVERLRPGRVTLAVNAHGTNGKPLFAHAGFTIGTPAPSLLNGKPTVTQADGTAALKLDFKAKPTRAQVTLNGKRVPLLRTPMAGDAVLPLAADDGLRFGANTVKVTAYDKRTGKWARTSTRFHMDRSAPLASAGRDVRVDAGAKVKLSAAASHARKNQLPLGYAWKIVSQPHGANAKLLHADTQRPTVKTTYPGRYRIQMQLIERSHGAHAAAATPLAQDVVSVDAGASIGSLRHADHHTGVQQPRRHAHDDPGHPARRLQPRLLRHVQRRDRIGRARPHDAGGRQHLPRQPGRGLGQCRRQQGHYGRDRDHDRRSGLLHVEQPQRRPDRRAE